VENGVAVIMVPRQSKESRAAGKIATFQKTSGAWEKQWKMPDEFRAGCDTSTNLS